MKCKEPDCDKTVKYEREDFPVTDNVADQIDEVEGDTTAALTCADGHTHFYVI